MTIRAELADGRILEFPDGTSSEVIQATVKKMLSSETQSVDPAYSDGEIPRVDAQGNPVYDYEPQAQAQNNTPQGLPGNAAFSGLEIIGSLASGVPASIEYLKESVQGAIKSLIDDGFTPEQALQKAQEEASRYAYQPQSEGAQAVLGAIDELSSALPPVAANVAPNIGAIRQSTGGATTVARAAEPEIRELVTPRNRTAPAGAVGAAQVEQARLRQERANELPIPIQLTKGQATQDMQQQRFERETAKTELGDPIRSRYNEQNELFNQNLDALVDETGTKLPENALYETGEVVTKALENQIEASRKKISAAYQKADNSKGAQEPVNLNGLSDFMNENMASAEQGGIMYKLEKEVKRLGLGDGSFDNGDLVIGDMTVLQAEQLRKFINKYYNKADEGMMAKELKNALDSSVGDAGGEPYRRARKLRNDFGKKYEEKKLISELTSTKPGSTDRRIALEKVLNKAVNQGSRDELINLRRTLQRTEEGREAFKELAAQALKDIKAKALGNVGQDEKGNPLVSPAKLAAEINKLDDNGKLDVLFGKKGAEQLRTLRDVSKDVFVSQPGAVNMSNTATVMAALLDIYASSTFGAPLPVTLAVKEGSRRLKNRSTNRKVKEAINFDTGANQ